MRSRRIAPLSLAVVLALVVPATVAAHHDGNGGGHSVFVAPHARVHGHAQSRLLSEWGRWVFGSPAESSDAMNGVCAPSPHDKKVWFLPASVTSGANVAHCQVPRGSYLLVTPGGYECSEAEGNGSTREELRACAKAGFAEITDVSVTVHGREYTRLGKYIKTTRVYQLPGPNLIGPDPGPSLTKGYFLFTKPMKPGHHTVETFIRFSDGFEGGFTYEIEVEGEHHH